MSKKDVTEMQTEYLVKPDELADPADFGFENPREKIDSAKVKELAGSIKDNRLRNRVQFWVCKQVEVPPAKDGDEPTTKVVGTTPDDPEGSKILIGGHRRMMAIELLAKNKEDTHGYATNGVPANFCPGDTLKDALYSAADDNLHREDLTTFEQAKLMVKFREMGDSQKAIAGRLHRSETWVSRKLSAFAKVSAAVKTAWAKQKITDENVEDLAAMASAEEQDAALGELLANREKGRDGKSEGRANAKSKGAKGTKVAKPNSKVIQELILLCDMAPKDAVYIKGLLDGFRFTQGLIDHSKFAPEFKAHMKDVQKQAEAKAKEEAKAAEANAKGWTNGKGKKGAKAETQAQA